VTRFGSIFLASYWSHLYDISKRGKEILGADMVVLVMGQQQWHMVAMAYETTSPWCSKVQQ